MFLPVRFVNLGHNLLCHHHKHVCQVYHLFIKGHAFTIKLKLLHPHTHTHTHTPTNRHTHIIIVIWPVLVWPAKNIHGYSYLKLKLTLKLSFEVFLGNSGDLSGTESLFSKLCCHFKMNWVLAQVSNHIKLYRLAESTFSLYFYQSF